MAKQRAVLAADEGVIMELEKPSLCGADVRRRIAGAN